MDLINLCPDHILAEMFGNLSPQMIKSSCLVCKRWNEIIGTSPKLMKRFQLKLEEPLVAWEIQRKYQSAFIKCSKSALDVIVYHNLISLILTRNQKITLSKMVNALNELSSLKEVNFGNIEFIDDLSKSSDSLTTIETNIEQLGCTVDIIHAFSCCTVKKLRLSCGLNIDENIKILTINFLKKQNNLGVGEAFGEFYARPDFLDLKFSLRVFKHHNGPNHFPYYESFIRFLSKNIGSLTSLEVEFSTEPEFGFHEIHKYALENIVNLKHIEMDYFFGHGIFNELPAATQITKNLESLELCGLSIDMDMNKSFIDLLPNLKYLNFQNTDDGDVDLAILHCISERCPKIESLVVSTLFGDAPGIIFFPKLKDLFLEMYDDDENFCDFVNRHSQILEKITILDSYFEDDMLSFTPSFAKAIINCHKLKYLKLNVNELTFGLTMMISNILTTCKQFTLILPRQDYKFVFPDDMAIFHNTEI